jgi:drug/metabolite transporter (DMT)-like permease
MIYWMILISFGLSVYQVLLKIGIERGKVKEGGLIKYLFVWQFIVANVLMLILGLSWAFVLQKNDFIKVYPLLAFAYVWSLILARLVFHEKISWNKLIGVGFIIAGIVVANA